MDAKATFLTLPKLATKLSCFCSEQLLKVLKHINGIFGQLETSNMAMELIIKYL